MLMLLASLLLLKELMNAADELTKAVDTKNMSTQEHTRLFDMLGFQQERNEIMLLQGVCVCKLHN